jgi:hypothetical protein
MRNLLSISILAGVATLAACDDSQPTTAPATNPRAASVPLTQVNDGPTSQAKPGGTAYTVITSNEFPNSGGAVAGWAVCPTGTTRISGGYAFTNEGNWTSPVMVSQNGPLLSNGWFVRVVNGGNPNYVAFKVYAVCAS